MSHKLPPLKAFDTPVKVLFTGYLTTVAFGYFFALIQILFTHGMADGKFGLSVDDIVYSYYGNRSGTVLETKLNGSMKDNASENERFKMIQWTRDGAEESTYVATGVQKTIDNKCVMCHNKEASGIPDFTKFENLKELTFQDKGATFASLTRVSHIHLFGISFIFMFVGLIFSFSETSTVKYKCIAIGMPYIFLVVDILSWWLTKLNPLFAWLVIFAGGGMAISFGFMLLISLLEMWFYNKIFLDSTGQPYMQCSVYFESKLKKIDCETTRCFVNKLAYFFKKGGVFIWKQWLAIGFPFIKTLFKRFKNNK